VIFSDESYFCLNYRSTKKWVKSGEIPVKEVKTNEKYGVLMVFGAISRFG
jgi:hypothetical protein